MADEVKHLFLGNWMIGIFSSCCLISLSLGCNNLNSNQQSSSEQEFNPTDNEGVFVDERDGQSYPWKRMADGKIWMTQNLNFETWGSWCYDNDRIRCGFAGRLYLWYSAIDACPNGWRLASDEEWKALALAYDGYHDNHIKEDIGSPSTSFKALYLGGESGFNAAAGGWRGPDMKELVDKLAGMGIEEPEEEDFFGMGGEHGSYFTSTVRSDTGYVQAFTFNLNDGQLYRAGGGKKYAFSCRCIHE